MHRNHMDILDDSHRRDQTVDMVFCVADSNHCVVDNSYWMAGNRHLVNRAGRALHNKVHRGCKAKVADNMAHNCSKMSYNMRH